MKMTELPPLKVCPFRKMIHIEYSNISTFLVIMTLPPLRCLLVADWFPFQILDHGVGRFESCWEQESV